MIEADICCIVDGVVTIGEAKRDAAPTRGQTASIAAGKYKELARRVLARHVVFATLSEDWSPETVERVRESFAGEAVDVVFLTGKELMLTQMRGG
jgi:hypothetical protein